MKIKVTIIGAITFLALSLSIALAGLDPPPYYLEIGRGGSPWLDGVFKGKLFSITLCLKSFKEPLTSAKMEVSLPPEVILHKEGSSLSWCGDLDKGSEECIGVGMTSKTDWKEWSEPIKAHIEFIHTFFKVKRELSWSHKGTEDSDWKWVKLPKKKKKEEKK